jgi:radical SAM protein with 4Fe4S-binding SPASM domain
VFTISNGIEVLENEDQRVLINPANREWIKLTDRAYELILNPRGKRVGQLVVEEALKTQAEPETIRSLFQYLKQYGFIAEIRNVVTLARAYLNLTARCNLRCPMCYFSIENVDEDIAFTWELSYEASCLVIDTLAKVDLKNLVITGGEPLFYRDFCKVLDYAKDKVPHITVLTNGTLVTEEVAEHIAEANARVQVSIEAADPEVHDSVRGIRSFKAAIQGIEKLVHAGVEDIEIVQTLTRESISESPGIIGLARELGVGYHFSLFLPVGRGACHIGELEIPTDELISHFVNISANLREETDGYDFVSFAEEIAAGNFPPPIELVVKHGCGAGTSIISIAPDGRVYPCPLLHTKSTVLGRLPEDSIWEILKQGASKIEDVTCLPGCLDCDVALFCGGGCRARAFAYTGDLSSEDPYCEFYRRVFRAVLWEWRDDRAFSDNLDRLLSCIGKEE